LFAEAEEACQAAAAEEAAAWTARVDELMLGAQPATLSELWESSVRGQVMLIESDVTPALFALATEFAQQVKRFWPYLESGDAFVRDVADRDELSVAMARCVLNLIIEAIRKQRKRFSDRQRSGD